MFPIVPWNTRGGKGSTAKIIPKKKKNVKETASKRKRETKLQEVRDFLVRHEKNLQELAAANDLYWKREKGRIIKGGGQLRRQRKGQRRKDCGKKRRAQSLWKMVSPTADGRGWSRGEGALQGGFWEGNFDKKGEGALGKR